MEFELSPEEMIPETAKYTLRALVLQGSDIPVFKFPNAQVRNDWNSTRATTPRTQSVNGRRSECTQRRIDAEPSNKKPKKTGRGTRVPTDISCFDGTEKRKLKKKRGRS